ncbi:DUF1236 domain-containing protein [Labrys sp. LIt4]|uniref:DUF1236 domain-containing protein n=2 Tax=Labrys okinawensis TaxID=346911 RepID=A0A2S9QJD0_9HYPH|nr:MULTISPECIES: DUF1236 domain-containing protein [Labrys]MBP0580282.1 DUF1236 domain-containing protein [Labrys sp. LIt4]PRH89438.1 hypothetical protein C5L14_02345 [Labrys okinawensis]
MKSRVMNLVGISLVALWLPAAAHAQGVMGGAQEGAESGNEKAGPVGGIVGGTVGAVTGGINGLLGIEQRPRFRKYVIERHIPSYRYEEPLNVGVVLPEEGVEYYDVPAAYGEVRYKYTVVNDEVVLVDPGTRRIVQIVE